MSDIPESGTCYRCDGPVTDEDWCYGCRQFICGGENCAGAIGWSRASAIGHGHEPEDHFIDGEEEESEETI